MTGPPPAAHPLHPVHRTIVCVDVEAFGDRRRTHRHHLAVRDGLYRALRTAFDGSGIGWERCDHEDRGDGALILVPADVPKELLTGGVPGELASALVAHNRAHDRRARIRLRLAVHAGEVHHDEHGLVGTAINTAFRLLDAAAVKDALAASSGVLAVIASQWFYDEVIRHHPGSAPESYRRVGISVKETETIAWICRPDDPYPPDAVTDGAPAPRPAPRTAVPRQLPGAIAGFAGRAAELDALTGLLDEAAETGGTLVISAIGGTAGIGKTTLAVQWAHRVADRFPDGQLYVNLRGFDPAGAPMAPAEAVRGFLDAFEVPAERIPVSLDAQAALYRSLLAGRRMLVVLDNARDADQIRSLLPGTPGCVVVVTSRDQLTGLIAEGARPLTLGLLTAADARQMLARRLGTGRIAAEPRAAEDILAACARLPLALAIVAARAATHPTFPLAALARELREAHGGLDGFHAGDQATDIRAVFSWSYQRLTPPAARLFRLLGLHPGPGISVPAAAGLAGTAPARARSLLAELAQAHLIDEPTPGRFTFHDLLRAYATEQLDAHDAGQDRDAAIRRMLDHYLHSAHAAALHLHPRWEPFTLPPDPPGAAPERHADCASALTWLATEHPTLLGAVQLAAAKGCVTHAWQLAWTLMDYFDRQGHWHDWAITQQTALDAARRHCDRHGQAHAHEGIGRAYPWLGRHEDARTHLHQALALYEEIGDLVGQANTHIDLCVRTPGHGSPADGLHHAERALALFGAAGHRLGQARALDNIGWYHALLGRYEQALSHGSRALALHRDHGDLRGEAYTLDSLGYAHHHLGRHRQAIGHFERALTLLQHLGSRYYRATVLDHLGDAHHAEGNPVQARTAWRQALDILDDLGFVPAGEASAGSPDTEDLRAKLRPSDTG